MRQTVVRLVHDLIDGDRPDPLVRIGRLVVRQLLFQIGQPGVEQFGRARIEGGEGTDDAGLALRRDERRPASAIIQQVLTLDTCRYSPK